MNKDESTSAGSYKDEQNGSLRLPNRPPGATYSDAAYRGGGTKAASALRPRCGSRPTASVGSAGRPVSPAQCTVFGDRGKNPIGFPSVHPFRTGENPGFPPASPFPD